MRDVILKLQYGKNLSTSQAEDVLMSILSGQVNEQDIEQFLSTYELKKYHWKEMLGFILALKKSCLSIKNPGNYSLIDLCGTGGSGKDRFNISTVATFVLAAANIYVAKHGNYGSKRPNGSFNFLEEMNIPFQFNVKGISHLLEHARCCFLFARYFHPGMRFVVNARKAIAKATVFNYLGPLVNPFEIDYQVVGLASFDHIDILTDVVKALKRKHVLFCLGGDGRDEVSLSGKTQFVSIKDNKVNEFEFDFSKEIESVSDDYECGDSNQNALLFIHLCIEENWDHPVIKHICINSAAAMVCSGNVESLIEGYEKSLHLFQSNDVVKSINRYKEVASLI